MFPRFTASRGTYYIDWVERNDGAEERSDECQTRAETVDSLQKKKQNHIFSIKHRIIINILTIYPH